MSKYAKSANGMIHLVSAVNSEYTMCGNAFDGEWGDPFDMSNDPYQWEVCPAAPITCPNCAAQIRQCRGVRIATPASQPDKEREV